MAGWYTLRRPNRSGKAVLALMVLAGLLVAAVPVALLVGLFMMVLGHVVGGLALFGGSILVAALAVVVAGASGMRHLRKMVFGADNIRVVRLDGSGFTDVPGPGDDGDHPNVVPLNHSDYTDIR
jgi:uncharacterized membrane protein YdjX (TVP38/TMEM64 family)